MIWGYARPRWARAALRRRGARAYLRRQQSLRQLPRARSRGEGPPATRRRLIRYARHLRAGRAPGSTGRRERLPGAAARSTQRPATRQAGPRRAREDEGQERDLDERERVVGGHPDGVRRDGSRDRGKQPASREVPLGRRSESPERATKSQSQASTPRRPVSSSVPSHWSSRMRVHLRLVRTVDDAGAEALPEERLPHRLAEPGAEVGDAAAAARSPASVSCSATSPPGGKNAVLSEPSVPGSAKWIAMSGGKSSGPQRRFSLAEATGRRPRRRQHQDARSARR